MLVSQDGTRVSAFALKLDANGTWAFTMPQADTDTAASDTARGPAALAGQWTHLTGVFDATAGELRLYVNGTKVAAAKHTATGAATGQLQAGRGQRAAIPSDFVGGNLDEVRAWSAVPTQEVITEAVVPAQNQRAGWCAVGAWLQAGGPQVKAAASAALTGTTYDRELAKRWKVPGAGGSAMEDRLPPRRPAPTRRPGPRQQPRHSRPKPPRTPK